MIRINLLPQRKQHKAAAGQRQLIYMGFALLIVVGVLFGVHMSVSGDLEALVRENTALQAEIDRFKAEMGDYDKVRAQREQLLRQHETIKKLQEARTGPVYLLREVSELLTPNKGPTFDRITYEEAIRRDPSTGFNPAWDTRRVWIDSFVEEEERVVRIKGSAKSHDDIAEFLKRLQASVFFKDVVLESTSQVGRGSGRGAEIKYMTFNLTTGVVY